MSLWNARRRSRQHNPDGRSSDVASSSVSGGVGGTPTTLLPLSYNHHHNHPSPRHHNGGGHAATPRRLQYDHHPHATTGNNFLLGGNYFPGKDKHKRQRRRPYGPGGTSSSNATMRWLARRALSRPIPLGLAAVLLIYVLRWALFSSASHSAHSTNASSWWTHILHGRHHGTANRRGRPNDWFWEPTATTLLDLPTQTQAVKNAKRLNNERLNLDETNQAIRFSLLERLSPAWFHRNDRHHVVHKQQPHPPKTQSHRTDVVRSHRSSSLTDPNTSPQEQQPQRQQQQQQHDPANQGYAIPPNKDTDNRRAAEVVSPAKKETLEGSPLRSDSEENTQITVASTVFPPRNTLAAMDLFANRTSCPKILPATEIVTTLVVQSSLQRSWVLMQTCQRWRDPIIAVIALTPTELENVQISHKQLTNLTQQCSNLHIVEFRLSAQEANDPALYPVNRLRNLGLDRVQTSHVLVTDVDFIPSVGLPQDIRRALALRQSLRDSHVESQDSIDTSDNSNLTDSAQVPMELGHREALVVPAFQRDISEPCETDVDCRRYVQEDGDFIPPDFDALRICVKELRCTVFQYQDNWEGHHSTRSERWLAKDWYEESNSDPNYHSNSPTALKDLKHIPCFDSLRYEPYVVIRWCPTATDVDDTPVVPAPFYHEDFHGYGKNKIEYIQHLRFMAYRFVVLPQGFIVHYPHPPSPSKKVWNDRQSHSLHKEMDALYPKFLEELFEKFKESLDEVIGQCKPNTKE